MISPIAYVLVALILISLAGIVAARKRKAYTSIPRGRQIYGDLQSRGQTLISRRYGISGKPDAVVRKGNSIIPYEYKSTDADTPRDGHLMQMGAYFLILEEEFQGYRVPYGILKYRNQAFRIDNTIELRTKVVFTVDRMRNDFGMPERNHDNPRRCAVCSFSSRCDQTLLNYEHSQPQWMP